MFDGERPPIYGDSAQSQDFSYIDNVIQTNTKAIESDATGEVLDEGCGDSITANKLVEELNTIFGTEIDSRYIDPKPGDVPHSKADISKAET